MDSPTAFRHRRPARASRRALGLLAFALLAACGESPTDTDQVAEVVLSRDSVVLRPGETLQLTATVRNAGREQLHLPVQWSSSDPTRVTVEAGLVRGVAVGSALVVASSGGRADTARVTVRETTSALVEARALWVNRFEYGADLGATNGAARIASILDKAKQARFNIVYFQVRGQGDAYYRNALEPCAIALCGRLGNGQPSWDPLEVAVREAHARGLQLHAWINAFSGFSAPQTNLAYCDNLVESAAGSPQHMLRAHPEWAVVNASGTRETCQSSAQQGLEYLYVSPGIPAARTHLARVAADIARRYAVDGIHLDRIRYPGTAWSHDTTSLRVFGRNPTSNAAEWAQFRRDQVNLAVREVSDSLRRAASRKVVLSAAVWGIYEDLWSWGSSRGYSQYFQDPRAWATGGYLDVAVPMTYFSIHAQPCGYADWACLLDDHLKGIQQATGRHLYIGIGANRSAAEVERQILLGRQKGVKGFALYAYTALESAGMWSTLANGAFRDPATVPTMGWN